MASKRAGEIESYYRFWTTEPHLTAGTGLSRYFDEGSGPAPEVISAELDAQGRNHYELIKEYFKTHQIADYDVSQYYDKKTDQLTPLFYKGDRSMRESGFDPSNRFGAFNIDVIRYDPGLPEFAAVPDGNANGTDLRDSGTRERGADLGQTRPEPGETSEAVAVG